MAKRPRISSARHPPSVTRGKLSEEDAQAKLRMLPSKSGYMLFLLAIALIFMSLFQNGFFQGIETVVAVYSYLRLVWRCLRSHCGRYERPIGETHESNQPMKPAAPLLIKSGVFATTPCRGLSPSRQVSCTRHEEN